MIKLAIEGETYNFPTIFQPLNLKHVFKYLTNTPQENTKNFKQLAINQLVVENRISCDKSQVDRDTAEYLVGG